MWWQIPCNRKVPHVVTCDSDPTLRRPSTGVLFVLVTIQHPNQTAHNEVLIPGKIMQVVRVGVPQKIQPLGIVALSIPFAELVTCTYIFSIAVAVLQHFQKSFSRFFFRHVVKLSHALQFNLRYYPRQLNQRKILCSAGVKPNFWLRAMCLCTE